MIVVYRKIIIHSNGLLQAAEADMTEPERVNKLLDILLRRDDRQLPDFCDALRENRQQHIVDILKRNGSSYKRNILCVYSDIIKQSDVNEVMA